MKTQTESGAESGAMQPVEDRAHRAAVVELRTVRAGLARLRLRPRGQIPAISEPKHQLEAGATIITWVKPPGT